MRIPAIFALGEGRSSSYFGLLNKGQGFSGKNDANYFCVPFMDMEYN